MSPLRCMYFFLLAGVVTWTVIHASEDKSQVDVGSSSGENHHEKMMRMELMKSNLFAAPRSHSPPRVAPPMSSKRRVFHVIKYGADPTGKKDSTDAILKAILAAFQPTGLGHLMDGIQNLGGAEINLDGGTYLISRPLRLPATGGGNLQIHSGSLRATNNFPKDRHLIELWPSNFPKLDSAEQVQNLKGESFALAYEFITLRDLLLDANLRGGGILIIHSLRTIIDNCYITNFTTEGIFVQVGHETYVRNSFLGQHITAGGDPQERSFSGTAISLWSNDNALTDVIIFSAKTGVLVAGQANLLTGVHCYNKATYFGGVGIHVKLPGFTQTRITNCYLDYTGILAEDPVQLHISNSFFLGNAYVLLRSIRGIIHGLNIVDNMFSGDASGVHIVQLDESKRPFRSIKRVIVDRNEVYGGMKIKSTVAKVPLQGHGKRWSYDFSPVLLFHDRIRHVEYSLQADGSFPHHALRNVSGNRIVIESDTMVQATVYISVDQSI